MGNFTLGLSALFRIWGDDAFATRVAALMEPQPAPAEEPAPPLPAPAPAKKEPVRSEALTLLAVLQREARLIDFLMEPIAAFPDAQIGAAVRGVHKDCSAALERLFAIQPLRSEPEDAPIEVPAGYDPAQFRLIGAAAGPTPVRGKLTHPGWKAARCELPEWNGRPEAALVLAPCEIQL
jgi:hypothetical protein